MTPKRTVSRARAGYQKANEEAATIIAGNPALYPEGGLMAQWADMVTSRAVDAENAKAGLLFEVADGRRPPPVQIAKSFRFIDRWALHA